MEVKIIRENDKELEFEVIYEKTILNPLKQKLLEYDEVSYAEWKVEHPLTSNPSFILQVKKGKPRTILKKAIQELKADIEMLLQQMEE